VDQQTVTKNPLKTAKTHIKARERWKGYKGEDQSQEQEKKKKKIKGIS